MAGAGGEDRRHLAGAETGGQDGRERALGRLSPAGRGEGEGLGSHGEMN